MALCVAEQRELDAIDDALQTEDPRLGSLFRIFTRLTRQEAMPWWERLSMTGRRRGRRIFAGMRKGRVAGRPAAGWLWAARAAPLALIAALSVLFLVLTPHSASGCGHAPGSSLSARAIVAVGRCPARSPVPGTPRR